VSDAAELGEGLDVMTIKEGHDGVVFQDWPAWRAPGSGMSSCPDTSQPTLTGAGLRRAAVVGILRLGWVSRRRFPRRASRRPRSPGAGVDLAEQQPRAGGRWGRLCQDSPVEEMIIPVQSFGDECFGDECLSGAASATGGGGGDGHRSSSGGAP
jgi:hypothetical protein